MPEMYNPDTWSAMTCGLAVKMSPSTKANNKAYINILLANLKRVQAKSRCNFLVLFNRFTRQPGLNYLCFLRQSKVRIPKFSPTKPSSLSATVNPIRWWGVCCLPLCVFSPETGTLRSRGGGKSATTPVKAAHALTRETMLEHQTAKQR